MCFSASASFGAGAFISLIGVASLRKAETTPQKLFAGIPLIFATQQIVEGFVWLSLTHSEFAFLQQSSTYIFLFIAQVVWPFWVPWTILKIEPHKNRRTLAKVLVGIGAALSLYLAYCLMTFHVEASIQGHHMSYLQEYPAVWGNLKGVFYVIVTIVPPFLSRNKRMWMLGVAILLSYILTTILYADFLVSVWCFFASIISAVVYLVLFEFVQLSSSNEPQFIQETS